MKCKYCGTELVKGIEVCHNCGNVNKVKSSKKTVLIAGGIVLAVAIVAVAIVMISGLLNKVDLYPMPGDEDGDTWGYVNKEGEWVIEPEYIETTKAYTMGGCAKDFHEGLAAFLDKETGLYGYIDESGEWAIEPQFIDAGNFSEGYAAVSKEPWMYYTTYNEDYSEEDLAESALYGYIDKKGEVVVEPKYAFAGEFANAYAWVKEVTDVEFGDVAYMYNTPYEDMTWGGEDFSTRWIVNCDRWELKHIDKSGKTADPGYPEDIYGLHDNRCEYYNYDTGLYGYRDKIGTVVITPQFSDAEPFSEGLALVQDERKQLYGFIDTDGNYVIKPKYEWARSFANGLALVYYYDENKDHEVFQYIDKEGNVIIKANYKYIY